MSLNQDFKTILLVVVILIKLKKYDDDTKLRLKLCDFVLRVMRKRFYAKDGLSLEVAILVLILKICTVLPFMVLLHHITIRHLMRCSKSINFFSKDHFVFKKIF